MLQSFAMAARVSCFCSCGSAAVESAVPLEVTAHSASSAAPVKTEEPAITSLENAPALLDGR